MSYNTIISINRQFCSGGRIIGEKVAKLLNYSFYDKKILNEMAEKNGYESEAVERFDDVATNSFLYSLVMSSYSSKNVEKANADVLTNDTLFNFQSDIIRDVAQKNSCVFVGRCADFILREHERLIKVYVRADLDYKIERYRQTRILPEDRTIEYVLHKADKKRASYYEYYSGSDWQDMENYDIVINTAKTDFDAAANMIAEYAKSFKEA